MIYNRKAIWSCNLYHKKCASKRYYAHAQVKILHAKAGKKNFHKRINIKEAPTQIYERDSGTKND